MIQMKSSKIKGIFRDQMRKIYVGLVLKKILVQLVVTYKRIFSVFEEKIVYKNDRALRRIEKYLHPLDHFKGYQQKSINVLYVEFCDEQIDEKFAEKSLNIDNAIIDVVKINVPAITEETLSFRTEDYNRYASLIYGNSEYDLIICVSEKIKASNMYGLLVYELFYPILRKGGLLSISASIRCIKSVFEEIGLRKGYIVSRGASKNIKDIIRDVFSDCSYYEVISIYDEVITTKRGFIWRYNSTLINVMLRKKECDQHRTYRSIIPNKDNKSFALSDVVALYEALKSAGCQTLTATKFYESCVSGNMAGNCLIKHDIHSDMRRTLNFAKMESDLEIQSVYFAMPSHKLTVTYFGSDYMWGVYDEIVNMGHELALHLDLHDLIIRYGDIENGIIETIKLFESNGFQIETANLHGNSTLRKLYGSPKAFLKKRNRDSESLSHIYPICDESFNKYYASVSLEGLAQRYGIYNWVDTAFFREGEKQNVLCYCSDNSGSIKLGCAGSNKVESTDYIIESDTSAQIARHCKNVASLFLLHPQYYELS